MSINCNLTLVVKCDWFIPCAMVFDKLLAPELTPGRMEVRRLTVPIMLATLCSRRPVCTQ